MSFKIKVKNMSLKFSSFLSKFKFIKLSFFKQIIIILCFSGCLYQIYRTCEVYFDYPIAVNVNIVKPQQYEMPAVSICSRIYDMKSISKLLETNLTKEFTDHMTEWSPYLLEKITFSESDLNLRVFLDLDENGIARQKLLETQIFTHINRGSKCLTITLKKFNQTNYFFSQTEYSSTVINFKIKFNTSDFPDIKFVRLIVHPSDQMVGSPYKIRNVQLNRNVSKDITFRRTLIHSLPAPYFTDCRNYSDMKYNSKTDCLNKCLISSTKEMCNRWPGEVFAPKSVELKFIPNFLIENCFGNKTYDFCHRKCRFNDCTEEFVTTLEIDSKVWINESQTNEFYLWLPLEHDYIYEYVPKFAFVEFLNYIAGIISVWFGISVFSLTTDLFSFLKRAFNSEVHKIQPAGRVRHARQFC